jgi:HEAT repeat protein
MGTMPTRRVLECIARFINDENDMVQEAAISALRAAGLPVEIGKPIAGDELLDNRVDDRV